MGQRRQIRKTHEAMLALGNQRAIMFAQPIGERVLSLDEPLQGTANVFAASMSYYARAMTPRKELHAAALIATNNAAKLESGALPYPTETISRGST